MTSLVEQASKSIKALIEEHRLKPGMHINIDSLTDDLCMSQTPIREALRKLVAEGLISHTPKTGYTVRNLTINEYMQILEMLCVLECHIAKELAKKPFLVDMEALYSINNKMKKNILSYDEIFFCHTNDEFHTKLAENYSNAVLKKHFVFLWNEISPKRSCMYCNKLWAVRIIDEHEKILKAIEEGDIEGVEKAMITHYGSGRDSAEAYFK